MIQSTAFVMTPVKGKAMKYLNSTEKRQLPLTIEARSEHNVWFLWTKIIHVYPKLLVALSVIVQVMVLDTFRLDSSSSLCLKMICHLMVLSYDQVQCMVAFWASKVQHTLIHWPLRDVTVIIKISFSNSSDKLISWVFSVKLPWGECYKTWWLVNMGSGNGLVLLSDKSLPESMLIQIYVAIASQGHNELTHWGLVMPYGVEDLGQHWFR